MYFTDRENIPDGQNTGKPASGHELEACIRNIEVKTVLITGSLSLQQGDIHAYVCYSVQLLFESLWGV